MNWGLQDQLTELEACVKMLNEHVDFQHEALLWWQDRAIALYRKVQELDQTLAEERRAHQEDHV